MGQFEVRNCCKAPDAGPCRIVRVGTTARADYGEPVKVVELVEEVIAETTAFHEASHAVAALALRDFDVRFVRVVGQPCAGAYPLEDARDLDHAGVFLAGPIGEFWHRRWVVHSSDHFLERFLRRVDGGYGGWCDACGAVRLVRRTLGPDATDAQIFDAFRKVERQVVDIVTSPPIWRAVTDLAKFSIAKRGALGDEIEVIARKHFEPGSFRIEL